MLQEPHLHLDFILNIHLLESFHGSSQPRSSYILHYVAYALVVFQLDSPNSSLLLPLGLLLQLPMARTNHKSQESTGRVHTNQPLPRAGWRVESESGETSARYPAQVVFFWVIQEK